MQATSKLPENPNQSMMRALGPEYRAGKVNRARDTEASGRRSLESVLVMQKSHRTRVFMVVRFVALESGGSTVRRARTSLPCTTTTAQTS
jgi:hypothetical protein